MTTFEAFYDCSSPWSYLGVLNARKLGEKLGLPIQWKPFLLGGIYNEVNKEVYTNREKIFDGTSKLDFWVKRYNDWARYNNVIINFPPKCGHPINSTRCMRACIFLAPEGKDLDFAIAACEALWVDGHNIGHTDVLVDICERIGTDPHRLLEAVNSDEMRAALYANTQELMDRGGWGGPTFFVNGTDIYFGNDRLPHVEVALRRSMETD